MDQDEIYRIIKKFLPEQWSKFVRTKLKLGDDKLEEIGRKFNGNFTEQKYQTIKKWGETSGNDCTKLRQLKHDFFCGSWGIIEEGLTSVPNEATCAQQPGDDVVGIRSHVGTFIDDSSYPRTGRKGCVLVISNSFVDSEVYRSREEATTADLRNMKKLWVDKIGCRLYDGRVHRDKSAEEMKQLLEGLAKTEDRDYVVAIISTHGGIVPEEWVAKFDDGNTATEEELFQCLRKWRKRKGRVNADPERREESQDQAITEVMFGNDERPLRLGDLKTIFYNNSATDLHDMPKFLILGYCRGDIMDEGVLKGAPEPAQAQALPFRFRRYLESLMPTVSDVLVSYSTHEMFKSFENEHGTWLLSNIAEVFEEYHTSKHVVDMLTIVHRRIKGKSGTVDGAICKQMSIFESSLVRDFYLA